VDAEKYKYKDLPQSDNKDDGTFIHLWICIQWFGAIAPTGVDRIYVDGIA
jgi:hypothetical protein